MQELELGDENFEKKLWHEKLAAMQDQMQAEEQIRDAAIKAEQAAFDEKVKRDIESMHRRIAHEAEMNEAKEKFKQAGMEIGQAFSNALNSAVEELAAGGEVDVGETVGNVLATILGVAGAAIGFAVSGGNPLGAMIGGSLGGLAGSAVKGATRKKRHEGGWGLDLPSYHGGAWVGGDEEMAVLQRGERVLSRSEVSAMGGASGVDAAARRGGVGGGVNVTVQTLDGSTARDYFERAGGRALLNAVRTGRGAPSMLFGSR